MRSIGSSTNILVSLVKYMLHTTNSTHTNNVLDMENTAPSTSISLLYSYDTILQSKGTQSENI